MRPVYTVGCSVQGKSDVITVQTYNGFSGSNPKLLIRRSHIKCFEIQL